MYFLSYQKAVLLTITQMTQNNLSNIDWGQQVEINRKQVAKRIKQLYACLAPLTAQDEDKAQEIPSEAGIEIQHALSHLALSTDTESKEQKAKRWHQALSHLNRALIDFLKLYKIYSLNVMATLILWKVG